MNAKLRMGLLGGGFAVAAWLAIFGDKTPTNAPVAVRATPAAASAQGPEAATAETAPAVAVVEDDVPGQVRRLHPRRGWFEKASSGRDLFGVPAPKQPPPEESNVPPAQPPVPPFHLIGRLEEQGHWSYFLERDGAAYVLVPGGEAAGFRLEADSDDILKFVRLSDRQETTLVVTSNANNKKED